MKTKILCTVIYLFLTNFAFSQSPSWRTLINAPSADSGVDRFDDTYFINSTTGWIIQGTRYFLTNDTGEVHKTTDGGHTWSLVNKKIPVYLRSIGFFDSQVGVIGTIDDSVHVLYRTTDGGFNWTHITENIQGDKPRALCGISIVNQTTAYACGRYYCPAHVIKTTNAGLNWISIPVDTSLARSLVDCYFWSPDSGIVVGGYSPYNLYYSGRAVVLMTTNAGMNWTRVYISSRFSEWCWKIQSVNSQLKFISIERNDNPTNILKTLDGGYNWQEIRLPLGEIVKLEGIGFVNENTGWVGGWGFDYNMPNYETTNGGVNWHPAGWGINMNRIRFISDTLAYSVGRTVYKYTRESVGIQQVSGEIPDRYNLSQNYPNPFNPNTKIRFSIASEKNNGTQNVKLIVYDLLGKEIVKLADNKLSAGSYEVEFNGGNLPSGIYYYRLSADNYIEAKSMILIK